MGTMACNWLKTSPSLLKGIALNNSLDDTKFEQFLRRIVIKLKQKHKEIFTEEERKKLESIFKINSEELLLAIKTIVYLFKRILKFIFMPNVLKTDLTAVGFIDEKVEVITKVWSSETCSTLQNFNSDLIENCKEELNFSWKLNSELCSDYHKRCKIPKAYISFSNIKNSSEIELTHNELHSIFLQIESIQSELDNLIS